MNRFKRWGIIPIIILILAGCQTTEPVQPKSFQHMSQTPWERPEKYQLGLYLASLVPQEDMSTITGSYFDPESYSEDHCLQYVKRFIRKNQANGHRVVWAMHDSFILVRAFASLQDANRLDIAHLAIWHVKDERFLPMPERLTHARCQLNSQEFIAATF